MMQADFMKMPFPDNTFDAVYAIEATCHAPDAVCIPNSNNYNLGKSTSTFLCLFLFSSVHTGV
jgi:hypothetical protein